MKTTLLGLIALVLSVLSPVTSYAQADLAVTGVRFSPNPIYVGDWITTTLTVSNVSSFDYTDQFLVNIQGTSVAVSSLAAGAVTNVTVVDAFSLDTAGTIELKFGIQADDAVYGNNWIGATLTTTWNPDEPYVLVTSPNAGEQLTVGQTYTINTVTNLLPAGTSVLLQIEYWDANGDVHGEPMVYEDVIGLYAGGQYKWTVPAKYASSAFNSNAFAIRAVLVGTNISSFNPPQDYSREFSILPQPFSLAIATNTVHGSPIYELSGMAGYSYSIQASTNYVDWTTIQTLFNTNGTVSFHDEGFTNYSTRFYRGVGHY